MAWSLSNTITWSSNADNHTAMVYLFDTVLSGFTNISVSTHPDASSFKRSWTRSSDSLVTGASYVEYFWVNWGSTSPTSLSVYNDETYTSVPGDLGTDTLNSVIVDLDPVDLDWKFWVSDVNSNSVIVTRGKRVIFAEIAPSEAYLFEDSGWTSSGNTVRSQFFPMHHGDDQWLHGRCWPQADASSSLESALIPLIGKESIGDVGEADTTVFWGSGISTATTNTSTTPGDDTFPVYPYIQSDVGTIVYNSASGSSRYAGLGFSDGKLILDSTNSRYYLQPINTAGDSVLVFDMGTSEPNLS